MSEYRWLITLKPHLRKRMLERCPGIKPARAADEVRAALAAGRLSALRPPWLAPAFDHRHEITLYAWTEACDRVYVLHTTERAFVVISVMTGKD